MEKIKFTIFSEDEGDLIPIELKDFKLFPVERIFTVSNVPKNQIRGNHAHHKTKQFLICIFGKIQVFLDDGNNKQKIILNKGEGVLVDTYVWDYQKFLTGNDFLLVLCSNRYNKLDYIENKKDFYSMMKGQK